MKSFFITCLLFCCSTFILAQSPVQQLTQQKFQSAAQSISPFSLSKNQAKSGIVNQNIIEEFQILALDNQAVAPILEQKNPSIQLTIPVSGTKEFELELISSEFAVNE